VRVVCMCACVHTPAASLGADLEVRVHARPQGADAVAVAQQHREQQLQAQLRDVPPAQEHVHGGEGGAVCTRRLSAYRVPCMPTGMRVHCARRRPCAQGQARREATQAACRVHGGPAQGARRVHRVPAMCTESQACAQRQPGVCTEAARRVHR